tara:strand:+ start:879 stop:1703 length:825 start_codon:yes stop_codon:yes gene_type:complete
MEVLQASKEKFICYPSKEVNTISCKELLNEDLDIKSLNKLGFLVVKNVIPKNKILNARNAYFGLFKKGEYQKDNDNWIHLKNHEHSHGCNNHPSKEFLKTNEFNDIVYSKKLFEISKKILKTENPKLSPRKIVRSFSRLSERCTYAHRDKEYFKSQNPHNVATCWIPLGPVGKLFGQLIYLLGSQFEESKIDNLVNSDKIISKDLGDLSKYLNLNWNRPIIEEGDVIFHSLEIVHASFDSNSNIPRLSIDLRFSASAEDHDPRWSNSWRGDDGL